MLSQRETGARSIADSLVGGVRREVSEKRRMLPVRYAKSCRIGETVSRRQLERVGPAAKATLDEDTEDVPRQDHSIKIGSYRTPLFPFHGSALCKQKD
jgi:hypothetical protein